MLASITVRFLALARAMTSAVSSTACGVGRLVMMSAAVSATASALWAISTPAALRFAVARRVDVVADHLPAGGDEVARERAAHDAEADDADVPFMGLPP